MDSRFFSFAENYNGRRAESDEFSSAMPVNVNVSYHTLAPALAMVENEYIRPVLGDRLFKELTRFYDERANDGENGFGGREDKMAELLRLVQMADVRLAYWDSYDQLKVNMSDAGAVPVVEAERRLYRNEEDNLRRSLEVQGFRCLDDVAKYCDVNADILEEYKESEYYSFRKDSLVADRIAFDKIVPINKSALVYNRIRPFLDETEKLELGYRLGEQLSTLVKEHREEDRVKRILPEITSFVVHWSYANACATLNAIPTEFGLMKSDEKSTSQGGTGRALNATTDDKIADVTAQERQRAERYMSSALGYIKKHLDLYPEAAELGGEYMSTSRAFNRDNKGKKSFVC